MMREKPRRGWPLDLFKALSIGAVFGIALGGGAFFVGCLRGGVPQGLEAAKNALAVAGAAALFALAGMLLVRGKRPERFDAEDNGWRRHFAVIGPKVVLGMAAAALLLLAALADELLRVFGA